MPNTNTYRQPEDRDPLWAADAIEERILFEGPETVAVVILEPVQNAGGCFTPPDGYWQRVREICDRYGVLLISDEVICSWGRLGHYFGAQRYDYLPDMITTAKGITSAYAPMGAVIASRQGRRAVHGGGTAMFAHGVTFAGHPMAAAVALANLDIFEREDLCGHVRAKEDEFRGMLDGLRELPIVGDVRGAGFFQAIELVKDQDTKESFTDEESETLLRGFLSGALYEAGLICRADDRGDPVIQLSPPLIADTRGVRGDRRDPARRADAGVGSDRQALEAARLLTVGSARRGAGARAGRRAVGGRDAGPLGPHHRAARPHALALGRRAAPDHRPPGAGRRRAARVRRAGWRSTGSPGSASAPASTTTSCRRRCSTRRPSSASRCSRCPTTCRSSRSPSGR